MNIHLYHHIISGEDEAKLDKILAAILALAHQRGIDMADLQASFADLKAKVANQVTVDNSVKELVLGLRDQLNTLAQQPTIDPAEVQAIADGIDAEQINFVNAVTAGTPAAPPGAALPNDMAKSSQKPQTNT